MPPSANDDDEKPTTADDDDAGGGGGNSRKLKTGSTPPTAAATAAAETTECERVGVADAVVVVSAPGKVLLAGGYVVLEPFNAGLVVGLDRRFYAAAELEQHRRRQRLDVAAAGSATAGDEDDEDEDDDDEDVEDEDDDYLPITVSSPQFRREWRYVYRYGTGELVVAEEAAAEDVAVVVTSSSSAAAACSESESCDNKGSDNNDGNEDGNPFIEKTLRVALLYVAAAAASGKGCRLRRLRGRRDGDGDGDGDGGVRGLRITIKADNDFYGLVPHLMERGLDRTVESIELLPRFLPVTTTTASASASARSAETASGKGKGGNDDGNNNNNAGGGSVMKTGLGSSACLVTSVVAAVYYAAFGTDENDGNGDGDIRVVSNLAQLCHCYAQGKVGSGFDVSAACYGSHVYRRFSKQTLVGLLEQLDTPSDADSSSLNRLQTDLTSLVESRLWSEGCVQRPIRVPSLLQVMLADVAAGGSESPGMARKVLEWKKKKTAASTSEDRSHWDELVSVNARIVSLFQQIETEWASTTAGVKKQTVQRLASLKADEWKDKDAASTTASSLITTLLWELRLAFLASRKHLKAMGDAVGVPIEPDVQTRLADATMEIPGVLAALVPGAGGYDAMACVYVNTPEVRSGIGRFWSEWTDLDGSDGGGNKVRVCPLSAKAISYGEGLRIEKGEPPVDGTTE